MAAGSSAARPAASNAAAVLSVGHFFEGTDAGMPTRLPWGVITPGDSVLGRVHPVQIYAAIIALALCFTLFRRLPHRKFAGEIEALALMLGGAAAFLLDMLRVTCSSSLVAGFSAKRRTVTGSALRREPRQGLSALLRGLTP